MQEKVLGLNLLRLLAQGSLDAFHIELVLPPHILHTRRFDSELPAGNYLARTFEQHRSSVPCTVGAT